MARLDGILREGRFRHCALLRLPEPRLAHLTPHDRGWTLRYRRRSRPRRDACDSCVPISNDSGRHVVAVDLPEVSAGALDRRTGDRDAHRRCHCGRGAAQSAARSALFSNFSCSRPCRARPSRPLRMICASGCAIDEVVVSRPRDLLISGTSPAAGEAAPGEDLGRSRFRSGSVA